MKRTKSSSQFMLCNLLFDFDSTPGPSSFDESVCEITPVLHIRTHIIYEIWSGRKHIRHKTTVLMHYIEYKLPKKKCPKKNMHYAIVVNNIVKKTIQ